MLSANDESVMTDSMGYFSMALIYGLTQEETTSVSYYYLEFIKAGVSGNGK